MDIKNHPLYKLIAPYIRKQDRKSFGRALEVMLSQEDHRFLPDDMYVRENDTPSKALFLAFCWGTINDVEYPEVFAYWKELYNRLVEVEKELGSHDSRCGVSG